MGIKKIERLFFDRNYRAVVLDAHGIHYLTDEEFIKRKFRLIMGYELDLENTKTFNEKLQWLKLHDRNPEYITMVDKFAAKKWVADRLGDEYIIPTLGVWNHFDEIDFDKLPNSFVLKCTHDSGGLVIVKDKTTLDKVSAKKKIEGCLKRNFYWMGREWPYKNVPPRIIAEQYMTDESGVELKDYKIFNFSGEAKLIQVDYDRFVEHKRNLYTTDWKYIDAFIQYPTDQNHHIERPKQLEKMLDLARTLSFGFPHVRTDFYCINDHIYFGELTFYHGSGFEKFDPEELGIEMGKWMKLPGGGYLLINDFAIFVLRERKPARTEDLRDYKIYCFNGEAKIMMIASGRFTPNEKRFDYFDRSGKWLEMEWGCPRSKEEPQKPEQFEELFSIAEKLAKGIPHVRVDLYVSNGQIYFGEMTFFDGSGFQKNTPEWDNRLGSWIKLPFSGDVVRK